MSAEVCFTPLSRRKPGFNSPWGRQQIRHFLRFGRASSGDCPEIATVLSHPPMARRGGRPRKAGARTASGRLSRSLAAMRDHGTPESQAKRTALMNGAPVELAATVPGILIRGRSSRSPGHALALLQIEFPEVLRRPSEHQARRVRVAPHSGAGTVASRTHASVSCSFISAICSSDTVRTLIALGT
jgi:hypothetical protein